ncbi:MAG: metallophosphoesterase [Lachnospiraceae bacterium]|nr:metallophosphoesterase [Lachnospiraceae bacterium]
MSFIISGDTHGILDIDKVVHFFETHEGKYTEEDYLIICGDVGVCGFSPERESQVRKILRELPVTTLFIDGNHENFNELNSYPEDEWNGGKVHMIENNIIHLMRGQVFDIDGTTFFTFGGAYSIDRAWRTEGVSWFQEEIPNEEEYEEGRKNLEKAGFRVDYVLSHTGPREVVSEIGFGEMSDEEVELRRYLQWVADYTVFSAWYFGHFHEDTVVEDIFYCLYDELIVIE